MVWITLLVTGVGEETSEFNQDLHWKLNTSQGDLYLWIVELLDCEEYSYTCGPLDIIYLRTVGLCSIPVDIKYL